MGKITVRSVTASNRKLGGFPVTVFATTGEFSIEGRGIAAHRREADRLQTEHDKDSDPVRVYVCIDDIPIYAGMCGYDPYSFGNEEHHRVRAAQAARAAA
jgi:hypothetical protein